MGVRRCLARSLTSLALLRTPKSANGPRSNPFRPDSPLTTPFNRCRKTQPAPSPHRPRSVSDASSVLKQTITKQRQTGHKRFGFFRPTACPVLLFCLNSNQETQNHHCPAWRTFFLYLPLLRHGPVSRLQGAPVPGVLLFFWPSPPVPALSA